MYGRFGFQDPNSRSSFLAVLTFHINLFFLEFAKSPVANPEYDEIHERMWVCLEVFDRQHV